MQVEESGLAEQSNFGYHNYRSLTSDEAASLAAVNSEDAEGEHSRYAKASHHVRSIACIASEAS